MSIARRFAKSVATKQAKPKSVATKENARKKSQILKVRVDDDLNEKFEAACKQNGKTVSSTVRQLMRDFIGGG